MAKIDDPGGKLREHYLESPKNPVSQIGDEASKALIQSIPAVGWIIGKVLDFIKSEDQKANLESFNNLIVEFYEALGKDIQVLEEKLKSPEHIQMVAVAIERIFWGANQRKVSRFAAVIAGTIANSDKEQDFEDAASFILALNELSEDDIRVLKHLYNHQKNLVMEYHAMDYNSFFQNDAMVKMIEDAGNLGMQMDEFYSRCNRLSGYGLALPLARSSSMGNPDLFAFRMTLLGKRLIDILTKVGGEITEVKKPKTN